MELKSRTCGAGSFDEAPEGCLMPLFSGTISAVLAIILVATMKKNDEMDDLKKSVKNLKKFV